MTITDTTEGIAPLPVGYQEPAEQTGSDDEVRPLSTVYVPVRERVHRNCIYKHRTGGWITAAPVGSRHFGAFDLKHHHTFEQALETFRIESALAKAKQDAADTKARLYRGVA
jgi:hypothetical protein